MRAVWFRSEWMTYAWEEAHIQSVAHAHQVIPKRLMPFEFKE
jgi:hypothetical protein